MDADWQIRERLSQRALALGRRVTSLEAWAEGRKESRGMPLKGIHEAIEGARAELERIDATLARIAAGGYGACTSCGAAIASERLLRLPHAASCDECAASSDRDYANAIRRQHEAVNEIVGAIGELLLGVERRSGALAALILIGDLGEELPAHFALEEQDGYLSEARAAAPRLSLRAGRLRGQHPLLRERAAALLERAGRAARKPDEWMDVEREFAALRADLLAHEQEENELMREAFMGDVGRGD